MTVVERRKHARISCATQSGFAAAFRFPDGRIGRFEVTARNVSVGGVAFMHHQAVEPGTPCDVILPMQQGELMGLRGTVRACRNVGILLKEIGVQFEEPLTDDVLADLALLENRGAAAQTGGAIKRLDAPN